MPKTRRLVEISDIYTHKEILEIGRLYRNERLPPVEVLRRIGEASPREQDAITVVHKALGYLAIHGYLGPDLKVREAPILADTQR